MPHEENHAPDSEPIKKPRRKKLLLPAILAVSLLGGSAVLTACGDDNDTKPDTVSQRDTGSEASPGDAGSDADLVV